MTGAMTEAIQLGTIRPVVVFVMELDTGFVRLSSADRNLTIGGELYYGVGKLGGISTVEETAQLQATTLKLSLSGLSPSFLETVLAEEYQGRRADLSLALMDDGYALIEDPVLIFRGRIDQLTVSIGTQMVVALTAENELSRWETPRMRRYTNADQEAAYPGDTSLRWVASASEREIFWGRAPVTPPSQTGGGAPRATVSFGSSGDIGINPGEGASGEGNDGDNGGNPGTDSSNSNCGASSDSCPA
jgi:hypothetical protein